MSKLVSRMLELSGLGFKSRGLGGERCTGNLACLSLVANHAFESDQSYKMRVTKEDDNEGSMIFVQSFIFLENAGFR